MSVHYHIPHILTFIYNLYCCSCGLYSMWCYNTRRQHNPRLTLTQWDSNLLATHHYTHVEIQDPSLRINFVSTIVTPCQHLWDLCDVLQWKWLRFAHYPFLISYIIHLSVQTRTTIRDYFHCFEKIKIKSPLLGFVLILFVPFVCHMGAFCIQCQCLQCATNVTYWCNFCECSR